MTLREFIRRWVERAVPVDPAAEEEKRWVAERQREANARLRILELQARMVARQREDMRGGTD